MRSARRSLPFFLLFFLCTTRLAFGDNELPNLVSCDEIPISDELEIEQTLETLMLRAQRGDQSAFIELWGRLEHTVRGQCRYLTRNSQNADDLFQDVALIAWQKRHQCHTSVGGWVRLIARRTWINKSIRERSSVSLGDVGQTENDPLARLIYGRELPPDDSLVFLELQGAVRKAVESLNDSAGVRTAAKLFYFEGLSLVEIAGATNRPVGTVKRQLFTARLRLRDLVDSIHITP